MLSQFQYLPIGSDSEVEASDVSDFLVTDFMLDASEIDIFVNYLSLSFKKQTPFTPVLEKKIFNIRKSHSLAAEKANKILVQEKRPRGAAGIEQQRTTRSLRVCAHSFMRE